MKRYKELIFNEKTYTENYKINEILLENGFDWFLDCEVENCRIEITKDTLVFNSGVFFNGNWVYGVFRDGQWKYGTWEGGVWYNGTWYNGIFKNGLIFGGRFLNGKIEGGEIRGGDFYGIHIGEQVTDSSMEQKEIENGKIQTGNPQNKGQMQKVPTIQPEKIEEKIKRFEGFTNEGIFSIFGKKKEEQDIPRKDDAIAEKILNYINNNEIMPTNDDAGVSNKYIFTILNNNNNLDIDPYNEDSWSNEDLEIKSTLSWDQIFNTANYYLKINDDELEVRKELKRDIWIKLSKIHALNTELNKRSRIKRYDELI